MTDKIFINILKNNFLYKNYLFQNKKINFKKYKTQSLTTGKTFQKYLDKNKKFFNTSNDSDIFLSSGYKILENKIPNSLIDEINKKIKNKFLYNDKKILLTKNIFIDFPEFKIIFQSYIEDFLYASFQSYYKIFNGWIFKSEYSKDKPAGSALWHVDNGPGTCIIFAIYLSDATKDNGTTEFIEFDDTYNILNNVNKELIFNNLFEKSYLNKSKYEQRQLLVELINSEIKKQNIIIKQPTGTKGTIVAFRNNILHKGGFPLKNQERLIAMFHCYPSSKKINLDDYKKVLNTKNNKSLPNSPDFDIEKESYFSFFNKKL